ncbi:MAG: hypothetical protein CFE26_04005 [Verrucomicrobiales bacterium VVV1]|nr:MAG: hypothetical protein CFE26_04005 [Verrucomicrobiales bacterium VVV1]
MSLRGFHIVFVTFCTLLFGFFAAWGFFIAPEGAPLAHSMGIVGLVGLVAMPFYGVYFYRKAKKLVL